MGAFYQGTERCVDDRRSQIPFFLSFDAFLKILPGGRIFSNIVLLLIIRLAKFILASFSLTVDV